MRHRWVRLREHVYICRVCGCGKVNEMIGNQWQTTYHRPDGTSVVASTVPVCLTGPITLAAVGKYADLIAAGGVPKEGVSK